MNALGLGLLLILVPQDPAEPVRELIQRLENDDVAVREEAQRRLIRIGTPALPTLRESLDSASGEVRTRLQGVIERITAFGTQPIVSLKVTDKPVPEILAEFQRQTGLPFRPSGLPDSATASLSVDDQLVWRALDDLCRARGDLMYRFADGAVEVYPSPYRRLPSADVEGLRFFIDRFIWERGPMGLGHIRFHGALLSAPGARVLWMEVVVDELSDDTGADLAPIPQGYRGFLPEGSRYMPGSKRFVFQTAWCPTAFGPPTLDARKFTRCRGKVVVRLAGGERVLARVKDPLGKPSVPAQPGPAILGIVGWKSDEEQVVIRIDTGWDGKSVGPLPWRLCPLPVLRLRTGEWLTPESWIPGHYEGEGARRGVRILRFPRLDPAEASALEIVVPDPVVTLEIPFDFRDIPLR